MKITGINPYNTSFNGKVNMNHRQIAEQIYECPQSTQNTLIGSINTLAHRLRTQTPAYKTFTINFNYDSTRKSIFDPIHHLVTISVSDEQGNKASNKFELRRTGGSRKKDGTQLMNRDEIWKKSFKEITRKAYAGLPESANDDFINEVAQEQGYDSKWVAEHLDEIKNIYDKIEDRPKVQMNKARIALSIFGATEDECIPDEIRESIIGNINTMTERVQEETSEERTYTLAVTNNYYINKYGNGPRRDALKISIKTSGAYEQGYLYTMRYDEESGQCYCCTDSESIYQIIFKPMTEGILSKEGQNLPSDGIRDIINKLH